MKIIVSKNEFHTVNVAFEEMSFFVFSRHTYRIFNEIFYYYFCIYPIAKFDEFFSHHSNEVPWATNISFDPHQ